jgi:hypothetical protein
MQTELISLLLWIGKIVLIAIIAKIAFDFILAGILTFAKIAKKKANVRRKLNMLKALEVYWLDNINTKPATLSAELKIMEEICKGEPREKIFLNLLKASNISYCYDYYYKISKTKFARLQLGASIEVMKAIGKVV